MNAVTETVAAEPVSGVEIFVPLAKLKKSPRNARKVPHGEAAIEALAASIQHKGLIQNLVVEPETKEDGTPTGNYLVTAGEGRRLAMLLRVKRKQIKKSEAVRCWLDTANDPSEISLDENVTRTPMHPADQFERFQELSENKGWGAEEIGARFGVSAGVVKQRLRLGAVSPKLLQVYREDGLTLDQLMAFAITEDHARQEQVFEGLHHNREPWIIRRDMTAANVPADDRRAVFVGADAYVEAGGNIIATCSATTGAGSSRMPVCSTCWPPRSCATLRARFRPKAGNGPRRISTILMPTGCDASIRSRFPCPTRMRRGWRRCQPSMTN